MGNQIESKCSSVVVLCQIIIVPHPTHPRRRAVGKVVINVVMFKNHNADPPRRQRRAVSNQTASVVNSVVVFNIIMPILLVAVDKRWAMGNGVINVVMFKNHDAILGDVSRVAGESKTTTPCSSVCRSVVMSINRSIL